jgi:S-adenosylmethionine-diacylgycerolhomoserine-N-methlytransferase
MIADFGDQRDLPWLFREALNGWLSLFDVHPRIDLEQALRATALRHGLQCDFVRLYRSYAFLAALRRCAS